jgi:hypothetical protein
MRTPEQPSVFINYNNFNPSSAYDSGANEIIVDDGDCMNAALYHEYRHYWQYKVSGYNKLIQKYREWFYDNHIVDFLLISLFITPQYICVPLCYCFMLMVTPRYIMECDANLFAYKRLKRKKIYGQYELIRLSMWSYTLMYYILPLTLIFK